MDTNNKHIDKLIKEKFDAFTPLPPNHIWAGIEKSVSVGPSTNFLWNRRTIAASAILLLALIASIILFNPILEGTPDSKSLQNTTEEIITKISDNNEITSNSEIVNEVTPGSEIVNKVSDNNNISDAIITETKKPLSNEKQLSGTNIINSSELNIKQPTINNTNKANSVTEQNTQYRDNNDWPGIIKMKKSVFVHPEIYSNKYKPDYRNYTRSISDELLIDPKSDISNSRWKIGYYISPELSISDFDSVQILNSYTLSAEPSYFFNDNWFVRFGTGFSFVRDRGFAKIRYLANEYMGSYDDVYDITFDTVSGDIVPVFHTKTVEVWDSVQHITVSEVTNKYIYMQIPVLFGYYHKKPGSEIGWYLMGGPAFNFKVGSWIDDPKLEEKNASIIELQNNLPIRSNNYFQLWFGAGLEYEVNKKLSIAVEPGYRYYFKSIYSNPNSVTSSGFTLRVGLVYNLK